MVSMVTKLGRMTIYLMDSYKSHDFLIALHARSLDKLKLLIFNTTVPMASKAGRIVNYLKRLPTIKLLNSLVTWFTRSPDQRKLYISTTTVRMTTKYCLIVIFERLLNL